MNIHPQSNAAILKRMPVSSLEGECKMDLIPTMKNTMFTIYVDAVLWSGAVMVYIYHKGREHEGAIFEGNIKDWDPLIYVN